MAEGIKFGSWLKQRRKELGLTQEELAERVDCSYGTMRKLEADERRPSGQIAHLLAAYFRIPTDEQEAFVTFARTGRAASGEVVAHAPWRNVHLRQTNLPVVLTPLIGREQQEAAARDYLLHPKTRLLTMTGPPGIGKTRLALQVASGLVEHFEDGVVFVDLAPVVDPDLVLPTVARSLGLRERAEQPIESALLDHVRERRILLLLDNFEQVLDATPAIVNLMQSSPWLKLVVTSREALHVRGERRFAVPPLRVPSYELRATSYEPSTARGSQPEILASYPAVELFVDRAQDVSPDFALTDENAEAIAAICVALEGLPLAIELAAAHARHFSLSEMRAALGSPLKLLTGGGQDLPARQRTLTSAIKWSYGLLNEEEQALFRRLGVFVGGFFPGSVDAVCGDPGLHDSSVPKSQIPNPKSFDLLLSLTDKSLVKQESLGSDGREPRFGMLETIREYALERLQESGETTEVERAHALYFMRLVEEAEPSISARAGEGDWLTRLDAEHDNLLATLRWAWSSAEWGMGNGESEPDSAFSIPHSAFEVGLRMACVLWRYWYTRGYLREWEEHLTAALASPPSLSPSLVQLQTFRAKALTGAGTLAIWRGDYASARPPFEESLAIRRVTEDKQGIAASLSNLGVLTSMQGDYASARALYEESLAIRRETGYDQTDKAGMANLLHNLAELADLQEDLDSARSLYEESLALRREIGSKEGISYALRELGIIVYWQGDAIRARILLEESLAIGREIGDKLGITGVLDHLGTMAYDEGDYASARSLYEESLSIRREIGAKVVTAGSLARLGRLAVRAGDAHRGAKLLGAAAALREKVTRMPGARAQKIYEDGVAYAQTQLGEEAFAEAWAEGHAMSLEEAIAYATGWEIPR